MTHHDKNIQNEYKNRVVDDECLGWLQCAQSKIYKNCKIWELKRNSILYKGITKKTLQDRKYYTDDKYIPGQYINLKQNSGSSGSSGSSGGAREAHKPHKPPTLNKLDKQRNFIYLAGNLNTAAYYTMGDAGRIISFKTLSRLRLLNMNDQDTLKYIYKYCEDNNEPDLLESLSIAFGVVKMKNGDLRVTGRYSERENDYKLLSLLQRVFIWIDGYAAEPIKIGNATFHEELAILKPSLKLIRHNIEYRPTNIVYYSSYYIITPREISELWYKIVDGQLVAKILIGCLSVYSYDPYNRFPYTQTPDLRDRFISDKQTYVIPDHFPIPGDKNGYMFVRGKYSRRKLIYYI